MGLNLAGSEVSRKEKQEFWQSKVQSAMGVSCLLPVKQVPCFWKMDVEERKKYLPDSIYDLCQDWGTMAQEEPHMRSDLRSPHFLV